MVPPAPPKLGGIRPRLILPKETVVEPAPSHDGAPCFTAYTVDVECTTRPLFVLRIYDTNPAAGSPGHIRDLAFKIHRGTEFERCDIQTAVDGDRIEVVGLPLPQATSDEQRVEACMVHHMADVAYRRQQHGRDFYLPATFDVEHWWRAVVVLDHLEEGWEGAALYRLRPESGFNGEDNGKHPPRGTDPRKTDPYGGFLMVRWELTELAKKWMEEVGESLPDPAVTPKSISRLGHSLADLREHMGGFRCFVLEGGLERELRGEASDWEGTFTRF